LNERLEVAELFRFLNDSPHLGAIDRRLACVWRYALWRVKGRLNFLVEALGAELAPYNVRANAVAPGLTRTAAMEERSRLDPEFMQALTRSIPLRRVVGPEAIAAGMVFLASSGGRSITGQILSIDGGRPGLGQLTAFDRVSI